jgi:predicted RNA-binding Zn ribbon-like protein
MVVIMTDQELTPGTDVAVLARIGGNRCLDFVNTLVAADEPIARDSLATPSDYRRWAKFSGIAVDAAENAKREAAALDRAKSLRAAIRAIAVAIADGRPVPEDAAELLTAEVERSFRSRRLAPGKSGLGWARTRRDLDSVTDELAAEAVALFADGATPRLKRCIGAHCGWLFLDLSRNGSRRWCSMQDCGNRAKARRHRERAREEA